MGNMSRWELRREPDNGLPFIILDVANGKSPDWCPGRPIIGPVRWFRDGQPVGDVLDGYPVGFGAA